MIAIIVGSKTDKKIFDEALKLLQDWKIDYEFRVLSAHRTLEETIAYAKEASQKNIKVIITAAGASAALPGIIAASTNLPVIGIPIPSTCLQGIDSLLSMVQMPKNVPVGVVSIGEAGAVNAVLLALRILALNNSKIEQLLTEHKEKIRQKTLTEQ